MQVTDVPSPTDHKFSVNPTPGPTWSGETGTSFLPEAAVERAAEGNPIEKAKLAKDATAAFNDVYAFAAAIRAGELDWKDIEKADMNTRLKWVGLVHRDKRTPGRFMMRLRTPNGIINSDLMRFYADCVEPYGPDLASSTSPRGRISSSAASRSRTPTASSTAATRAGRPPSSRRSTTCATWWGRRSRGSTTSRWSTRGRFATCSRT